MRITLGILVLFSLPSCFSKKSDQRPTAPSSGSPIKAASKKTTAPAASQKQSLSAKPKKTASVPSKVVMRQVCAVAQNFADCRARGITLIHISEAEEGGCALDDKGVAYCWGDGTTGRLGTGCQGAKCRTDYLTPVAFPKGTHINALSCSRLI